MVRHINILRSHSCRRICSAYLPTFQPFSVRYCRRGHLLLGNPPEVPCFLWFLLRFLFFLFLFSPVFSFFVSPATKLYVFFVESTKNQGLSWAACLGRAGPGRADLKIVTGRAGPRPILSILMGRAGRVYYADTVSAPFWEKFGICRAHSSMEFVGMSRPRKARVISCHVL